MQPEVLMLFFRGFSFLGNGKENAGKCTKVISNVLPRLSLSMFSPGFPNFIQASSVCVPKIQEERHKVFFCILFL